MRHVNRIFLLLVALVLFITVAPIALLYVFWRSVLRMSPGKALGYLSNLAFSMALSIDLMGNVVGRDLFNAIFIKPGAYSFGNNRETISSVLGKNKQANTLTDLGRALANLLDFIDKGHTANAAKYPLL